MLFRAMGGIKRGPSLGALTVTGTNETARWNPVTGLTVALLQRNGLTEYVGLSEAPVMVAYEYAVGTTITTNAAVLQLCNAGTGVTGALVTIPTATNSTAIVNAPFATYDHGTLATTDTWSVKVSTAAGAGAITGWLVYVPISYPGLSDANTTT